MVPKAKSLQIKMIFYHARHPYTNRFFRLVLEFKHIANSFDGNILTFSHLVLISFEQKLKSLVFIF